MATKVIHIWNLGKSIVQNNSTVRKYLQPCNQIQVEERKTEKMSPGNHVIPGQSDIFGKRGQGSMPPFALETRHVMGSLDKSLESKAVSKHSHL